MKKIKKAESYIVTNTTKLPYEKPSVQIYNMETEEPILSSSIESGTTQSYDQTSDTESGWN